MSISLQDTGVDHKKIQGGGGDVQCDFWDPLQVSLVKRIIKIMMLVMAVQGVLPKV